MVSLLAPGSLLLGTEVTQPPRGFVSFVPAHFKISGRLQAVVVISWSPKEGL